MYFCAILLMRCNLRGFNHCSWENVSTAEKMLAYSQRSTKNVKSNTKTDYEKWEISCFRIYVSL